MGTREPKRSARAVVARGYVRAKVERRRGHMRAKVERRGIGGEDIEVRRSKHRGMGATHPTAADPPGPSVVRPTTIDSRFVSSASRGSTTPARLARPDQDAVAQGRSRPPAAAHGRVGTAYRGRGRSSSSAPRPSSLEARGGRRGRGRAPAHPGARCFSQGFCVPQTRL